MDTVEKASHELVVRFGRSWYKLVGASLGIGAVAAIGTYLTGRMVFVDTFKRTDVVETP